MKLLVALLPAILSLLLASSANAQAEPVWLRTFPESLTPRCVWLVAAWSDETFTIVPWQCQPGVAPVEAVGFGARQAVTTYPQTSGSAASIW